MKNNNGSCIESIKLDDFSSTPISVSVNDKQLPLKIGSKIEIEEENPIVRTVTSIKIDVDGNASYCLEWFDGMDFKADWVSLNEIYFMHMNNRRTNHIGLN